MTVIPSGILVPDHCVPAIAAIFRQHESTVGGLPAWLRPLVDEFQSVAVEVRGTGTAGTLNRNRSGTKLVPETASQRIVGESVGTRLAAKRLGKEQRSVRKACEQGRLQAAKVGKLWRIPVSALDEFARSSK
jgi:excisionase family DNA binding protein